MLQGGEGWVKKNYQHVRQFPVSSVGGNVATIQIANLRGHICMDFQEVKQVQTIIEKEDCEQLTEKQAVLCSTVGFRRKLTRWNQKQFRLFE